MSIPEIQPEYIYALAGVLLLFLVVFLLKRKKRNVADKSNNEQLHREEIIAAANSNDSRAISRMVPIASSVVKKNPEPIIADEEFAAATCKLLLRGGQKLLCRQLLEKSAQQYSQKPWYSDLEISFLTSQKQIDERTFFKLQDLHKKYPENSRLIIFMANYYDKKKNYKAEQLDYFVKAAEVEPKEVKWHYAMARCRQNSGDLKGALAAVNQLLQIDSGFPGARDLKRLLEDQINPPKPVAPTALPKAQTGFVSERYSQVSEMGRGGMGVVYKAFDEVLQRWVAIKTLQESIAEEQPELKQRFLGEARVLAALDHAAIPKVFDLSLKPPYYLAFELIDGRCLREIIKENPQGLPLNMFLAFAADICSALAYANSKSVLHRDIKPENILVQGEQRCYVIDFGLAQIEGQANLTKTGLVMGTPWYLAPERFKGEPATAASEIYALGVMLFELLEGSKPYEGEDVNVVMVQEPKKISRQDCSPELKILVSECLSKNPANRPEEFTEILAVLENELKKSAAKQDRNNENNL